MRNIFVNAATCAHFCHLELYIISWLLYNYTRNNYIFHKVICSWVSVSYKCTLKKKQFSKQIEKR